ncbi:adenosine deaminase-like protein isoform X2 [Oenanthe melanoleuca]|uniref:adenosine deaminase-like protein isoform X2 n=1 Tax=Oenanthe melanoleuca TaxID=2939378 RepID=UPI0024C179BE|nr:adenosine deaminase-like protein isoform X2 [Oenanthe melanoleuca]XP_056355498.1 adenosine deaminase-like protein isoform X2 [Oenanthe melanoleuca]
MPGRAHPSPGTGAAAAVALRCCRGWKCYRLNKLRLAAFLVLLLSVFAVASARPRAVQVPGAGPGAVPPPSPARLGSSRPAGTAATMAAERDRDRERELRFYRRLPKAELHAHLNGCISSATMKKLMAQKPNLQIQNGMTVIDKGKKRTLDECFQMFQIIYRVTTRTEDILLVTKDVIKEFADDGVKYLELRSTPREENSTGMTKRMYVETVLEGIKQCQEEGLDIDVRLLIAINRRDGPEIAKQTVKLAEEFLHSSDGVLVGLDLSGDPTAGRGQDFLEPLSEAKKAGLKLALHLSEIPNQEEETRILLGLPPDRIGHGTFLNSTAAGSEEIVSLVQQNRIPIEFCMTSNIKSQTVPSCDKHHFGYWYNMGHPAVLCEAGQDVDFWNEESPYDETFVMHSSPADLGLHLETLFPSLG